MLRAGSRETHGRRAHASQIDVLFSCLPPDKTDLFQRVKSDEIHTQNPPAAVCVRSTTFNCRVYGKRAHLHIFVLNTYISMRPLHKGTDYITSGSSLKTYLLSW